MDTDGIHNMINVWKNCRELLVLNETLQQTHHVRLVEPKI